jgi:DegV family protein with EDD domain
VTVKTVTDSSCDLAPELVDKLGITVVPLTIRFGAEEFVDGRDLTPEEFWKRCHESPTLPETAAPSPGLFEEAFRAAADAGHEGVVSIHLSAGLSATFQSAQLAAAAVAERIPVAVIDSRQASVALGLIVVSAAAAAERGETLETIAAAAESEVARTKLFATLDTLENLRKGGRIGAASAFFGTMLQVKPVIELEGGVVHPESRQRTRAKSLRYLAEKVGQYDSVERVAVTHAQAPDLEEFLDLLAPYAKRDDILIGNVGPVIGAHSGPRAIGVSFQLRA